MNNKCLSFGMSLLATAAVHVPLVCLAQEPGPDKEVMVLDSIVVTATKRDQELFEIIGDAAVVEGEDLRQRGFTSIDQIDRVFPDVHIRQRSSRAYTNITVRGQYSTDFYNPSTQLYIDGLPQDQALLSQMLPQTLDRVELLYGPQGTLYGRGAIGGVINVVTRKPGNEFRADLTGRLTNLDRSGGALVNTPLVKDTLYGDISFNVSEEDSNLEEIVTGNSIGDSSDLWGQARLRYAPDDGPLDVMLAAGRTVRKSNEEHFIMEGMLDDRAVIPVPSEYDLISNNFGLTASYDFGGATMTSLTGYQDRELDRLIFNNYTPEWQDTFSQEVRIASNSDRGNAIDYVAGLYFQNIDFRREVPAFALTSDQDINSYAAFGEATWHATDRLDVLAGLRFDYEDVEAKTSFGTLNLENSDSFSAVSPKGGASYAFTEDVRAYALFSTGFKAGGFTRAVSPQNIEFSYDPQHTYNYEAGVKAWLFGDALELSSAVYYTKTDDYQLSIGPIGAGQWLANVGEVKSKGVDFMARWHATDNLLFTSGVAYNDTYFSDYENPFNPGVDLTDNQVPYAPKVTAHLGASYTVDLPDGLGQLVARAGMSYVGKTYFDEANNVEQDAYALFDAGLSWAKGDYLTVDAFVDNITDETYAVYGFDASAQGFGNLFQVGRGRTYGARLTLSF